MNDAVMLEGDMSAVDAAPDPAPAFDYEVWLEAVLSIARH